MLSDTIKEVKTQAQKSASQVSYRMDLLNKRSELKKLYEALGKVQYQIYISQEESVERDILYSKIKTLKDEIEALEIKIEEVINTQKDSFDHYKRTVKRTKDNEKTSDPYENVEILKVCPVCNTGNYEHAAYCIKCGNKFES